jgi:hypothetical protein
MVEKKPWTFGKLHPTSKPGSLLLFLHLKYLLKYLHNTLPGPQSLKIFTVLSLQENVS